MCVEKDEVQKLINQGLRAATRQLEERMFDCNKDVAEQIRSQFTDMNKHLAHRFDGVYNHVSLIEKNLAQKIDVVDEKQDRANGDVKTLKGKMADVEQFKTVMELSHTVEGRAAACPSLRRIELIEAYITSERAAQEALDKAEERRIKEQSLYQGKIQNLFHKKNYRVGLFVAFLGFLSWLIGMMWDDIMEYFRQIFGM